MCEKAELIYRSVLILLIVAFLAILYQYSENGRYTFHKEINDTTTNKYVVDTRSGIIYGEVTGGFTSNNFYKINLKTGEIWISPVKYIDNIPEASPKTPSK